MSEKVKVVLFWLISLTRGLPTTLFGLIFFLVNIAMNNILDVQVIRGRLFIRTEWKWGGISLGAFVFIGNYEHDEDLKWHELGHTVQNLMWGPLMPFVINIPSFIRAAMWDKITAKNPKADYYSIWFERQANEYGEKLKQGEWL